MRAFGACVFILVTEPAVAEGLTPSSVFLQGGKSADTRVFTAGATWDWDKRWTFFGGRLGGYTEASIAGWNYPEFGNAQRTWLGQVALVPVLRFRPSEGESPWFAEAGIGVSYMSKHYQSESTQFVTRFNFADHLSLGRNFGDGGRHEMAIRFEHFSNAGFKEPNPGENVYGLRYSYRLD